MRRLLAVLLTAALFWPLSAPLAVQPGEMLEDPALEARARDISKGIRCLVCQNQDIDSSNADLARDLRVLIRERLVEGDSDEQVESYLVERYGDYVLLKPPFKASTYLLWVGPFVILLVGALGVAAYLRRSSTAPTGVAAAQPLSESERRKVQQILSQREES